MKYSDFFKNKEIIEALIGYTFRDEALIAQAFTRTSFCNENNRGSVHYQSNEVLEFLGDSALSLAVATMLTDENLERYERGIRSSLDEGDFSNIKSKLSDKTNLSESIKKLGVQKYLLMGEGDVKLGIENQPSVMEDLFESIIGAVYIDSEKSLDAITRVIGRMLDVSLYLEGQDKGTKGHPKNLLQEWCADKTRRLPTPKYRASVCGPEHAPTYTVECTVGDMIYGVGKGKNIKSAEALAANEALTRLADEYSPESVGQSYAELIKKVEAYRKSHGGKPHEFFDLRESAASTKTRPEFSVKCRFGGVVGVGIGASKKEAQGEAILDTLRRLGAK